MVALRSLALLLALPFAFYSEPQQAPYAYDRMYVSSSLELYGEGLVAYGQEIPIYRDGGIEAGNSLRELCIDALSVDENIFGEVVEMVSPADVQDCMEGRPT